tara:strand:+ start:4019 stop:4444 length:426 start_codon:yes stop_codon:yes gene_type:complete
LRRDPDQFSALCECSELGFYDERRLSGALTDEIAICCGREADTDPEQRVECAAHVSPPVPAEHEFVEIALQVVFPKALEHAFRPSLQVGEHAVDPVQDLMCFFAGDDLRLMRVCGGGVSGKGPWAKMHLNVTWSLAQITGC